MRLNVVDISSISSIASIAGQGRVEPLPYCSTGTYSGKRPTIVMTSYEAKPGHKRAVREKESKRAKARERAIQHSAWYHAYPARLSQSDSTWTDVSGDEHRSQSPSDFIDFEGELIPSVSSKAVLRDPSNSDAHTAGLTMKIFWKNMPPRDADAGVSGVGTGGTGDKDVVPSLFGGPTGWTDAVGAVEKRIGPFMTEVRKVLSLSALMREGVEWMDIDTFI